MHHRLPTCAVLVALLLAATVPDVASAGQASGLRADLNGRPIPVLAVSQYYCHDFNWPAIHCYSSPGSVDAAVRAALAQRTARSTNIDSLSALNYIRLYDLSGYAGAYIYLSANYPDLSVIGWNDRASSYVAVNNLSSSLSVNTYYQGATLFLCCNQHAPSLSSTFDNHISSAERS